jgi:outer membrane biosynthesis protein TonB
MRSGLINSIILHITILSLFLFGVPILPHDLNTDYAVTIDVVDISDITNLKVTKAIKDKEKHSQAAKKIPKAVTIKEEPKVPTKETKENKQIPKKLENDEHAEKIPDKNVKPNALNKEDLKPKVEIKNEKSKHIVKKKKVENDIFARAILNSLEESSQNEEDNNRKLDNSKDNALKGETNKDYNPELPLSLSEIDALQSHISKNWNATAFSGANSLGMRVSLLIKFDAQGKVLEVIPKDNSPNSSNAFIDSAIRAVKKSSPLPVLAEKYNHQPNEIQFNFDSSKMIY